VVIWDATASGAVSVVIAAVPVAALVVIAAVPVAAAVANCR
jgi:hypothetical protein